jgi:hypothetical protein
MSEEIMQGLPSRSLSFAEMGTYDASGRTVRLVPLWAWRQAAQPVVGILCAVDASLSFLGFDSQSREWHVIITQSDLTTGSYAESQVAAVDQWLFGRYAPEGLVRIKTDPAEVMSSRSSLSA